MIGHPPGADAAEDSWVAQKSAQSEEGSGVMTSEQLSDSVMIASSVLSSLGGQVRALALSSRATRAPDWVHLCNRAGRPDWFEACMCRVQIS